MSRLKVKQISDFSTAVQNLIDNDADQNAGLIDALEASVDSLETATGGDTTAISNSIDSLETLVAADAGDADASIDSLETALGNEISATNTDFTNVNASVDSLEVLVAADAGDADASIDSLEDMVTYLHRFGTVLNGTSFQLGVAMRFGSNDDLSVFINGHNIHPLTGVDGDPTHGYSTTDGQTFTLTNIGYTIDAEDEVYVIGHR